ncbi:hypothetical protein E2C01_049223 [Portunus trituberculatus]|uniref:Uncharacterized protein n=1 Tax=Portunus trituberculatus TaxID=210409 RepID=A0A5B7G522_PORTR|nr:hypothetical protein [Portunus trituberculatus]
MQGVPTAPSYSKAQIPDVAWSRMLIKLIALLRLVCSCPRLTCEGWFLHVSNLINALVSTCILETQQLHLSRRRRPSEGRECLNLRDLSAAAVEVLQGWLMEGHAFSFSYSRPTS